MRLLCRNQDVFSCVLNPNGTGYTACTGDHGPVMAMDQSPMNPAVILAQCNTPLAVTVSMEITVDTPAAFIQDLDIKMAVEAGIASAANVSSEAVGAVLTVASRRLDISQRRLQGNVNIDATIHTLDTNEVETLRQTVAVIEPSAMTASINAAFKGAVTVEVAAIGLPVVAPPASGTAESEAAT